MSRTNAYSRIAGNLYNQQTEHNRRIQQLLRALSDSPNLPPEAAADNQDVILQLRDEAQISLRTVNATLCQIQEMCFKQKHALTKVQNKFVPEQDDTTIVQANVIHLDEERARLEREKLLEPQPVANDEVEPSGIQNKTMTKEQIEAHIRFMVEHAGASEISERRRWREALELLEQEGEQ